ncbi:MAG: isoprenylcysteine carboxylmethyltransferase family protein [Bacteroidetes bacterium]|nr:isoprenylcysteine carboxylmethyltransferase family protein [Bacteroidota bacterium]
MFYFILLLVFFYASHSWLASEGVKDFFLKCSASLFQFYRLFFTLFSVLLWSVITWLFIYKHDYTYIFSSVVPIKYGGIFLAIAGLFIIALSILKYGFTDFTGLSAFVNTKRSNNTEPVLNTGGMNSIVRHPIYTGIIVALIGLALIIPTQMTAAGVFISFIYLEIGIGLEEKKLEKEFGDSYRHYKLKVKKVIPFLY